MKKQLILFVSLLFLMLLSCQKNEQDQPKVPELTPKKEFIDDLGKKLTIPFPPKRIIGLAPNLTEILFEICPDSQIVGRTQNCNFPNNCLEKPIINTYPLDMEGLLLLKPDIIFVTEGITSLEDINRMRELNLNVYYIKHKTLSELINTFETIGEVTDNLQQGKALKELTFTKIEDLMVENEKRTSVLALASKTPIYVFGENTLFTEKIYIAGGVNVISEQLNSPYPEVTSEYILKLNPEIILGGSFEAMDSTFFKIYPELKKTKAYKRKNVFEVNDDLMTRPSPRVTESIEELISILKKAQ